MLKKKGLVIACSLAFALSPVLAQDISAAYATEDTSAQNAQSSAVQSNQESTNVVAPQVQAPSQNVAQESAVSQNENVASSANQNVAQEKPAKPAKTKSTKSEKSAKIGLSAPKKPVQFAAKLLDGAKEGVISLSRQEVEIALHQYDYDNSFQSVWVNFPGDYDGTRKIKWVSDDLNIAKVDQQGRIFPQGLGETTIWGVTKDGAYKASAKVLISKYGPKPKTDVRVSTDLTGDAYVTFGADLDTGKTGFTSDQRIKLKVNLLNLGEVWSDNSDALPIWGEIRIYAAGDALKYAGDTIHTGNSLTLTDSGDENDGAFRIYVDHATIHMGNAFIDLYDKSEEWNLGYINYTTGPDVAYEFIAMDTDRRYGQLDGRPLQSFLSSTADEDSVYGLRAGYQMDGVFRVAGDFASTLQWRSGNSDPTQDSASSEQKYTDYVYKLSAGLLLVPNLYVEAGYSNGILGKDSVYKQDMRFGLQASYQWDAFDIYYVKPKLGVTLVQSEGTGSLHPLASASVLFGWEDKQTAYDTWYSGVRPRYLKDDYGAYPGVALAVEYADGDLASNCVINDGRYKTVNHDVLILHGSFNTGNGLLVDRLEALGAVDVIDALSDQMVVGTTLGFKYWAPLFVERFSVAPKAFVTSYFDSYDDSNSYTYLKAGLDFSYQRVSFSLNYESNDLIHGFYDSGDGTYNKFGKVETTFKVWF